MMTRPLLVTAFIFVMGGVGSTQHANTPPAVPSASTLAALVDRFSLDRTALTRRYAAEYSPERYARLTRFYQEWQQELGKVPFETLNAESRIDQVALAARARVTEQRLLAREQAWVSDTAALIPFSKVVTD